MIAAFIVITCVSVIQIIYIFKKLCALNVVILCPLCVCVFKFIQ